MMLTSRGADGRVPASRSRVLVGRRRFLGLDEAIPTLDPDLREDMQVEHTKVGQVGMTFSRVTRDREEAPR
jgi:ABC-type Fe3+/spermidine/putrescine transport system ATPase subunit